MEHNGVSPNFMQCILSDDIKVFFPVPTYSVPFVNSCPWFLSHISLPNHVSSILLPDFDFWTVFILI